MPVVLDEVTAAGGQAGHHRLPQALHERPSAVSGARRPRTGEWKVVGLDHRPRRLDFFSMWIAAKGRKPNE